MQKLACLSVSMIMAVGVVLAGWATPFGMAPVRAATILSVNNTVDAVDLNPGDGVCRAGVSSAQKCTLRAAIMEANALAGTDSIILPAGTYTLTLDGNASADNDDTSASGDLDAFDLILRGTTNAPAIIQGGTGWSERILEISDSSISAISIRGGNTSDCDGGGGVLVREATTFTNVTITSNAYTSCGNGSGGGGVAIEDNGNLTLINSTVSNNTVSGSNAFGGGIFINQGALTLLNSALSNNRAVNGNGGGPAILGEGVNASFVGSTLSNNTANQGGGVAMGMADPGDSSDLSLTNSTISGNTALQSGGGLFIGDLSHIQLASVTIAKNSANSNGGFLGGHGGGVATGSGTVTLKNTIIAENIDHTQQVLLQRPDCSGTLTSQGFNLIQSTFGCTITGNTTGNKLGQDPALGPLQNNGGATFTHAIDFGQALDSGDPNGCTDTAGSALVTDQRGIGRHQGVAGGPGQCDIGAVETVQPA